MLFRRTFSTPVGPGISELFLLTSDLDEFLYHEDGGRQRDEMNQAGALQFFENQPMTSVTYQ